MNTINVVKAALAVTAQAHWEKATDKWVIEGDYGYISSFASFKKAMAFAKEEAAVANAMGRPTDIQVNL
jgi:pterin-4a-carbinolamine dehydratase